MNCQEAIQLWSSFQDGELDAALRGEIAQHLRSCPACREFYAAQAEFDAALGQTLRQGQRTPALWQKEEAAIRAALAPAYPPAASRSFWAALFWPSPRFYAGLAAVWLVLLAADRWASPNVPLAQGPAPTAAQLAGLAEQRREMKALLMAIEKDFSRPAAERPRTESAPGETKPVGRAPEPPAKRSLMA